MANDNEPNRSNPNHWRERAKEARALAEQVPDPEAKRAMSRAADHYEWLAQCAEEQLAQDLAEQPKPKHFIYDPEYWQCCAQEAGAIADDVDDPEAKRAMLKIADRYGLLAERAGRRAANGSAQTGGGPFGDRVTLRKALSRHLLRL
jgi:hypothetical protein